MFPLLVATVTVTVSHDNSFAGGTANIGTDFLTPQFVIIA